MQTLEQHNRMIQERDEMLRAAVNKAGVLCNQCGTEMRYSCKTSTALHGQHVECPKCGARGFKKE
jgi:predicted RNA-binding Zn-ribbon protein involved in translation (DUF1610 family)